MWPVKDTSALIGGEFIFSKKPLQDLLSSFFWTSNSYSEINWPLGCDAYCVQYKVQMVFGPTGAL